MCNCERCNRELPYDLEKEGYDSIICAMCAMALGLEEEAEAE